MTPAMRGACAVLTSLLGLLPPLCGIQQLQGNKMGRDTTNASSMCNADLLMAVRNAACCGSAWLLAGLAGGEELLHALAVQGWSCTGRVF